MKKSIFITLMAGLFLISCVPIEPIQLGSTSTDTASNKSPTPPEEQAQAVEEIVETAQNIIQAPQHSPAEEPTAKQVKALQQCQLNLVSALWRCTKGEEVVQYFLNQQPSHIDEGEDGVQKRRICELKTVQGDKDPSSDGRIIAYAHWEKSSCANRLNKEAEKKQTEGFVCESTEFFDEERPDTPCLS